MVKHTQTIRQKQPTTCLNVFDHFMGLVLKGLINFRPVLITPEKFRKLFLGLQKGPSANWNESTLSMIAISNTELPLTVFYLKGTLELKKYSAKLAIKMKYNLSLEYKNLTLRWGQIDVFPVKLSTIRLSNGMLLVAAHLFFVLSQPQ